MTKPEWLKEVERKKSLASTYTPKMCKDCAYFGKPIKQTKHRGKERVWVHECDIHPGCMNTVYSVCCGDWMGVDPTV